MYPKNLGRYRIQDSLGVRDSIGADELETRLREQQFDLGNARYVLSLPPGEYLGEDGGDVMNIYAVGAEIGEKRDLICSVPAGSYRIENDEAGAHLYRLSDDEAERQPLGDTPIRVGDNMPAALARMNQRMSAHYGTDPSPTTKHVAHRDLTERLDASTSRSVLAYMNERNRAFWSRGR